MLVISFLSWFWGLQYNTQQLSVKDSFLSIQYICLEHKISTCFIRLMDFFWLSSEEDKT